MAGVVGLFVVEAAGAAYAARSTPAVGDQFRSGQTVEVALPAGDYVLLADQQVTAHCSPTGDTADGITVANHDFPFSFERDGETWQAVSTVQVRQRGTYRMSCGVADPDHDGSQVTFTLAEDRLTGGSGFFLVTLAAEWGVLLLGLLVAAVVALVTLVRRSSHKNRLHRQRRAAPGSPPVR